MWDNWDNEHRKQDSLASSKYNRRARANKFPKIVIKMAGFFLLLVVLLLVVNPLNTSVIWGDQTEKITVYCASALRRPVHDIASNFEAQKNIEVETVYGNSGELLSQILSSSEPGIFIPGDPRFLESIPQEQVLTTKKLAYHYPVFVIRKPLADQYPDIESVQGQALEFILVEPDLSALGDSTEMLLQNTNIEAQAEAQLKGVVSTASQVPLYLNMGVGDIGITWHSNYTMYQERLEIVDYPQRYRQHIPVKGAIIINAGIGNKESFENKKYGTALSHKLAKYEKMLKYINSPASGEIFQSHGYLLEAGGD